MLRAYVIENGIKIALPVIQGGWLCKCRQYISKFQIRKLYTCPRCNGILRVEDIVSGSKYDIETTFIDETKEMQEIPMVGVKDKSEELARRISFLYNYSFGRLSLSYYQIDILDRIQEFEQLTDISETAFRIYRNVMEQIEKMPKTVYEIRIESPFILTATQVKEKLGIGYKVVSCEVARDIERTEINSVDDAAIAIINTGYRALARAYHPDLGGNPNTMMTLNRCKSELKQLLESIR